MPPAGDLPKIPCLNQSGIHLMTAYEPLQDLAPWPLGSLLLSLSALLCYLLPVLPRETRNYYLQAFALFSLLEITLLHISPTSTQHSQSPYTALCFLLAFILSNIYIIVLCNTFLSPTLHENVRLGLEALLVLFTEGFQVPT